VTRESGRFTAWVPAGKYCLEVKAEGYASSLCPDVFVIAGASATPVRVLLCRPATVNGHVRTHLGGVPECLSLYLISESSLQVATLAEDGAFSFDGLTADTYELAVGSAQRSLVPREKITLAAGTTIERDIVLPDLGSVDVEVVDAQGAPVAGAEVALSTREGRPSGIEVTTIASNAAGHVRFEQLLPGSYGVVVERNDRRSDRLVVNLAAGGHERCHVVLAP